jgi:putative transposase
VHLIFSTKDRCPFLAQSELMLRAHAYIQNQPDHHLKMTFETEFRQFLRRYEISFDERYVWD